MTYGDFEEIPEEKILIKYLIKKHLILLKTQNMIHINAELLQWFIQILIRSFLILQLLENIKI